jgi:hypothetical protein
LATPHDAAGDIAMGWDLSVCSLQYASHFPRRISPMLPGVFLFVVFGITVVACLAEGPFGKYKRKV